MTGTTAHGGVEMQLAEDAGDLTAKIGGRVSFMQPRPGEPVDALGIPWRVHYAIFAISAFNLAAVPLAFSFTSFGQELAHPFIRAMCVQGILMVPGYLLLARRLGYEPRRWFFHGVFIQGLLSVFISSFFVDQLMSPLVGSFLLTPIGAAYYLTPRQAFPHIVAASVAIASVAARSTELNVIARCLFLGAVVVGGGIMLNAMRSTLLRIALANRELSQHDALTGAANVRLFEERLAKELQRHSRGGAPFALVAVDLDDFKRANDLHSHSVGDAVLERSVAAMQAHLTDADLVVRRGGDEFVIVAPQVPGRDLDSVLHDIRESIARERLALCSDVIPTATTAWVESRAGEPAEDLLQRVDDALHSVKADSPSTRRGTVTYAEADRMLAEASLAEPPRPASIAEHRVGQAVAGSAAERERAHRNMESPKAAISRLAWRTAAAATAFFVGVVLLAPVLDIADSPVPTHLYLLAIVGGALLVPAFAFMSRQEEQSEAMRHVLATGTLALITLALANAGELAAAGAEMYLMVVLVVAALLSPRAVLLYLIATYGLYGYFLFTGHAPFAGIRFASETMNTFMMCLLLGATHFRIVAAAEHNAELARTDALTGLPNLRRLRDRLEDEVRRAKVTGSSVGLLMLDLDDFKSVNDRYSHSLGDRTLVAVADAVSSVARHAEMPARRGGDEFALVLTDADERAAATAAARVAEAIERVRLELCPAVTPTASVGLAVWRPGESVDDLLARADVALHEQKEIAHAARGGAGGAESNESPAGRRIV